MVAYLDAVHVAGVLGLDNLDYTASVLDMARSRGQLRLKAAGGGAAAAGGTSTHDPGGGSGRDAVLNASAAGSDGGGRQRVVGGGGSSARGRLQGGGLRLSGRRRGGQPAFRRLSMSMSPQQLRKVMDIMNAGRRR